jgi:hypothetical protein
MELTWLMMGWLLGCDSCRQYRIQLQAASFKLQANTEYSRAVYREGTLNTELETMNCQNVAILIASHEYKELKTEN